MKNFFSFGIIMLLIIGSYMTISHMSYKSDLKTTVSDDPTIKPFTIEKGSYPATIANALEEQGFIISAKSFLKYLRQENLGPKIQAGYHEISENMTIPEITENLLHAIPQTIKITIPEGLTLAEIDQYLAKKEIFQAGAFLDCVQKSCNFSQYSFLPDDREYWEGYFFPATYNIEKEKLSAEYLSNKMLEALQMHANQLGLFTIKRRTLHEIITMASIIEKEWGGVDEGNMISGILWNRIDNNIPLGADATIRYAIAKKSDALTISDLKVNSPFNSRIYRGLPPYPIAAPGRQALDAALNPATTNYFYYLHDPSGQIRYGKTNAEHEYNKRTYCRGSCE